MYLGQGYFLLLVWVAVAAYELPRPDDYDDLNYNLEAPLRLELFKIGSNELNTVPFDRLNTIPVVQRPVGFQRPMTTRRPFRKRPTTAAIRPTTPRPQPVVLPQTRPPQIFVRPQPARPQVQPTTPQPLPATVPPPLRPLPPNEPFETNIIDTPSTPETIQFPIIVPEIPTSIPNHPQTPIVVLPQATSSDISQPLLSNLNQSPILPILSDSFNQPFGPPNQGVPYVPQILTVPEATMPQKPVFSGPIEPQSPPSASVPESPFLPIIVPDTPSFPATNVPQSATSLERPPAAPSQSQLEAQPPFAGPNLPPNRPALPTFSSSQANTGAGGGRPQGPLVFPLARPPLSTGASRPPFRPRPPSAQRPSAQQPIAQRPSAQQPSTQQPSAQEPSAQPPFDSGPFVPPKPPPVPVTSTTSFGVNPAPPVDKPQRPLPPSRPILQNPLPLPKPPFQLTTTEKPSIIFSESSMTDDGNYTFNFLVSNSVFRKEQGFLKKSLIYPGHLIHIKTGAYSFTSPEGTFHRVDFVADEHGYRAFESTN